MKILSELLMKLDKLIIVYLDKQISKSVQENTHATKPNMTPGIV